MRGTLLLVVGAMILCLAAVPAGAELYSLRCVTSGTSTDAGIGEAQFSVEVTQGDTLHQVVFTFENAGPLASSITDIYFYDGVLLGYQPPAVLTWSEGVVFDEGAIPKELPGLPNDGLTRVFSADADSPVQPSGVNPGEWLKVLFVLDESKTWEDVVEGLNLGLSDPLVAGAIRIGIHGQGFADGGSESFVHAPLPAAVLLGMLGMGVAGLKLRKFV